MMNATTKKAGKQQRAAFAIEGAIEDTRRRLGGSAKDLQRRARAALEGARLTTERDGRLFAMDTLDRLMKVNADKACAYAHEDEDEGIPWRSGPQWPGLQRDLFKIFHEGTEAAQLGFCAIFTDALTASDLSLNVKALYREREAAGKFPAWGTTPKARRTSKAKA